MILVLVTDMFILILVPHHGRGLILPIFIIIILNITISTVPHTMHLMILILQLNFLKVISIHIFQPIFRIFLNGLIILFGMDVNYIVFGLLFFIDFSFGYFGYISQ